MHRAPFIVVVVLAASSGCELGGDKVGGCTSDADCAAGETCDLNTPNADGSPGTCIPAEGEGEGEGEAACDTAALADSPAGDVAVTGCVLERQGTAGSDGCNSGSPFVVRCDVTGATGPANVAVSVDGGAPGSCTAPPAIANGAVDCELCLELVPSGLAVEVTVDGADSGAACVDVSRAT